MDGDNGEVDHWQYKTYFTWVRYDPATMQKLCDIRVLMKGNPHDGRCRDRFIEEKSCWTAAECAKFRELYEAAFFDSKSVVDWVALKKGDKIHEIWSHLNIVLGRYPHLSEVNHIFKSVVRIWGCRVPIVSSQKGEELRDMNDIRIKLLMMIPTTSASNSNSNAGAAVMPLVDIGRQSNCYYIWVSFERKDDGTQQAYLQVYTLNFDKPEAATACRRAVTLVNDHLSRYRPRKNSVSPQPTTPLSVSADGIDIRPVKEDPAVQQAGGSKAPAVSPPPPPCPRGGYPPGFQYRRFDAETMTKLCDIRAAMTSKAGAERCCWSASEVSRFKELYYDKLGPGSDALPPSSSSSSFWRTLPKGRAMPDFWSHMNIVLGRYPTPSELKTMFPDGALRIWQFSAELFSREPLRGPGLTDIRLRHLVTIPVGRSSVERSSLSATLSRRKKTNVNKVDDDRESEELLPLVQIGQQANCFRLWVHVVEAEDDATKAFMSMYTTAYQKRAARAAFQSAIDLVNAHAATYAPRKPSQPNWPLQILNVPEPRPYDLTTDASFSRDADGTQELPPPIPPEDVLRGEQAPPARFPKLPMPK